MRILQVFNRYLFRGGEEMSVERISDTLSERHEVFHCYFDSRQMAHPGSLDGVVCAAGQFVWNPVAARRFRSHFAAVSPDIVLIHNFLPFGSIALLHEALKMDCPVVMYVHNFRPFSADGSLWCRGRLQPAGLKLNFFPEIFAGSWQGSRVRTALCAAVLYAMHRFGYFQQVTAWVAISEFIREKFVEGGLDANRVFAIPHSWCAGSPPRPRQDGDYFLFLGRLTDTKGIVVLLECWQRLHEQCGEAAPRLIIGGDGPLRSLVEGAAGASSRISYRGQVSGDEKKQLIEGCRAMVAPSLWWEPLGLVTYEAFDFEKPMLAARSGGLVETIIHGETGFLHTPGNTAELAEQVMQLWTNPGVARGMGLQGRKWLLENTSSRDWLEKMDALFKFAVRSNAVKLA